MGNDEKYIINECRHCGNKTKLDIVASHLVQYRENFWCDVKWLILKCCACEEFSFAKIYSGEDTRYVEYDGSFVEAEEFETLYPAKTYQSKNVPKAVHSAFEAALKARHLDENVCLLALRRTLEIICKNHNATGKNLYLKIQELVKNGILPPTLNEASFILKDLGNEAAHGDEINYGYAVVKEMLDFTQIIIEYLYVLPYRIKKIKKIIEEDKIYKEKKN